MPLLLILSCICFVASLSIRILDPVVPQIARDFATSPESIALLATAVALPYAFSQPVLGPLGDSMGKIRLIKVCLAVLLGSLLVSALAPTVEILFASRVVSGLAGGGLIPVALAVVGDRFALADRQVALSRVLAAMLGALLFGSIASGLIAEAVGWRVVMGLAALMTGLALAIAMSQLQPRSEPRAASFRFADIIAGYVRVFENPRAKMCFIAVFIEGLIIFGFLPYIAILLEARGAGGIRQAGFILAGMGVGGLLYAGTVRSLLQGLGDMFNLMRVGGVMVGLGFLGVAVDGPWTLQALAFVLIGFGFYGIHSSLQTQATELAPGHRGAAVSLHAFFFFLGHAAGPPLYALALGAAGSTATLLSVALITPCLALLLAGALGQEKFR